MSLHQDPRQFDLIAALRAAATSYFGGDTASAEDALPHVLRRLQQHTAAATKRCDRCYRVLPLGEYARNAERPDALFRICRDCQAIVKAERAARDTGTLP